MRLYKKIIYAIIICVLILSLGFFPGVDVVNADKGVVDNYVSAVYSDKNINIIVTANFPLTTETYIEIKPSIIATALIPLGFGEHVLGCYDITSPDADSLKNATVSFEVIAPNAIDKTKRVVYRDEYAVWQAASLNTMNDTMIIDTDHFSSWSVIYADWGYRVNITVDKKKMGAGTPLVNFTVLVNLSATNFNFTKANANGSDIRFTDANDTALSYEIESWNYTNKSARVWVRIPLIQSATNTVFCMYYNNSQASFANNSVAVWNGSRMIQHLEEVGGTGAYIGDSTPQNINFTPTGTTYLNFNVSKIDGGRNFTISDQLNTATDFFSFTQNNWAIEMWIYQITNSVNPILWRSTRSGEDISLSLYQNKMYYVIAGTGLQGTKTVSLNAWHQLTSTYDGATMRTYLDGVFDTSVAKSYNCLWTSATARQIGLASADGWGGYIDEVRLYNYTLNSTQISTNYNSTNDALLSFGTEEAAPPPPPPPPPEVPPTPHPNHVTFSNLQYEYAQIVINETTNITSDINVTFPSGYYQNYTMNSDREIYIYCNQTGIYNYYFYYNASTRYNGSFVAVKNYDYENNLLYDKVVNQWVWGVLCIVFIVFFMVMSKKSYLYGMVMIVLSMYMLIYQTWLPSWISISLLLLSIGITLVRMPLFKKEKSSED